VEKTVGGIPNRLNYVIFVLYTQYTNVTAGSTIQPGGTRVGDPWSEGFALSWTIWDSKNSIILEKLH
jgi:hypothetical protein